MAPVADDYIYSVTFHNESQQSGTACLYQTGSGLAAALPVFSVAWLTKPAAPTTNVVFRWNRTYDFVWADTGVVGHGALITSSQLRPASEGNHITLTNTEGRFSFVNQRKGATETSLYLDQDETIPANMASVGIGMADAATFVVQSQPNTNLIFTPQPLYFITFGSYTTGQALDPATLKAQAIVFPPNVLSMAATLQIDNTWKIESMANKNAVLVADGAQPVQPAKPPEPGKA